MSQRNSERDIKRGNNKNKQTNNRSLPGHFARDCPSGGSRTSQEAGSKPRPSPSEIEEDQLKTLSDNFNSAELSYGGSDKIVFAPLGDELKNAWKRFMKKELIHQHKMRNFITSCLTAIDKQKGDEVEELVTELGKQGLERMREIVMFPMSVDAGLEGKVASFQRVILPFMALLTRSGITECIVEKYAYAIFYTVYLNLDSFMHDGVITMLEILVQRNDIVDKKVNQFKLLEDDAIAFIPSSLCNVFMKRIKEASTNETMYKIVTKIEQAKKLWQDNLQQDIRSTYDEPLASNIARREYFFTILDREIESINKMLNYRQPNLLSQETQRISYSKSNKPDSYYGNLAKKVASMLDYDPPGELSKHGKRHNNDFVKISEISIIPTKEEILCDRDPFLPTTNIDDTLYYLPKGARRLLDTQFRLLREDMMCPIRLGIDNFIKFISESDKNKAKIKRLQGHGGRHKYEGMEGGDLNVYANVHFSDVNVDKRRGFYCRMGFTQPPMQRNSGSRQQYWNKSGKLMNGSLVCLLWPSENNSPNNNLHAFRDEKLLPRDQHIALIDISFIDSLIYQLALKEINKTNSGGSNKQMKRCFMVESTGVYFESYFHILKALQTKLPSSLPFEKYLAPQITENSSFAAVDPPIYARAPQFVFDLSILLNDKNKRLLLNVADRFSHEKVIQNLQKSSRLDNTQAKSLVYSLCREVALIEEDTQNIENIEDSKDFENFEGSDDNYIQNWLLSWVKPKGNRSLKDLKDDPNVWQMSKVERIKLHDFWKEILSDCDVIGMTTNGAAKFQTLISSIGPRIIICEEAGEVLEAHILSALTSKTQHMILIGDHNQLRPHCATYTLTCDSKIGANYALDKSLFERLVNGDQAMRLEKSQLCTQRRMRREISDLIRHTLYKELVDDENSVNYPDVRGAQRNVYFMDHRNSEDSSENDFAVNSHSNTFEVKMVIGLVKHFVRHGYNKPGQIAVLTPYLGQLIKIRDILSKSFLVVIDERDDQLITDMEESIDAENKNRNDESTSSIEKINIVSTERKKLSQQVILRTVDNFQGEEADIVIISLVRNENDRGNIGFLKSTNRSNVLLSRAKHGMFLLGNADLMGKHSEFWRNVVEILRKRDQVGPGFPIVCTRHPDYKNNIYEANQFNEISPDGGCFEPCPYKCHPDDMQHIGVRCQKACTRLHPDCQHPCNKICGEDCGDCLWPIGNITLPCGHEYKNAKCHNIKNINKVLCQEKVLRKLPNCEHEHLIKCHISIYDFKCTERCSKLLPCEHPCMSACFECQDLSKGIDQDPSLDKCEWQCEHEGTCNLPCGVPCNRLPCNLRCEKLLECGHQCFGLCGEKCPPSKYCAEFVDLIMQESFAEVDWTFERMIVLACGHVYTADSLDHLMEMKEYYEMDLNGQWIGLKTIISQPSDPKNCPQCRTPIKNICRYGRAIKKNVLDIQNKKFLRAEFLKEIQIPLKAKEMNNIENNSALQIIPEVISTEQYTLLEKYSIPSMVESRWKQHISVLLAIYRKLIQLIEETKFPPHKRAYGTAVSLLYAFKTRINISDDSQVCQNLKLQETLTEVGLTAPKMDVRIYLDAFLEIVNIQKAIFHEISLVIPELSKITGPANKTNQTYEKNWIEFGDHIIETIKTHLNIIITTAQQNSYLRHAILTLLELMEVECRAERFRLKYPPTGIITPIIQSIVKNKCSEIEGTCKYICNEMIPKMNAEHFENQSKLRVEEIYREVLDLRKAAMRDRPLTHEEKLEIRRAMNSEFLGSGVKYRFIIFIYLCIFT
ncbi:30534_t:CDS:10 [Gigaspora margarita]|uniref:30534_t:CDS:1 n=1 Tax=Gigaspora margarita TaxID=4874 RepID=A0ABM8VY85_GIGMA|nr:30534_t:CDS:10 [Gigaspora margarita]